MLATRRAYGVALETAGRLLPQVVCLDGDVSNSTFAETFARAHPERYFECKIAEQNMISAGAGLAAAGHIPFTNSFAKFIARGYDQVELANISRANLKIVGSHAGITPSSDGPSQMGLLDVAFFRALTTPTADNRRDPLCWLFQPADAVAAWHLTRLMIELPGMCYMRTFRPDVPFLYDENAKFEPRGFGVLRSGEDLALIGAGYMTHVALQVADHLAKQSIRAAVIDAYCLPVDRERLIDTIQRSNGRALVIEDNYGGGLGSAVAELCSLTGRMRCETAHVNRVPKSTRQPQEELVYCGVGPEQLADRALAMLKRVT
jgi:transketolase